MSDLDVTVDGNLTNETTPDVADRALLIDNSSTTLKDITLAVLWQYAFNYIATLTAKTTLTGADKIPLNDSAASDTGKYITWTNLMAQAADFVQTLTNKRITKRVASTTDDATSVIDSDSYDEYYLTAVANATEFSITGTPTAGQTIFIGFKDAGVSKALTWTGITALGVTLPTATTASKQHIVGIKRIASAWRAIAVSVEA